MVVSILLPLRARGPMHLSHCWEFVERNPHIAHRITGNSNAWIMQPTMTAMVQTAPAKPLPERYESLLRVSQSLISKHCSQELFSLFARELREVVNFYFLGVGIYNEKT